MNRETKRMMQRQGQMEADGSPATRRAPAGGQGTGGRGGSPDAGQGPLGTQADHPGSVHPRNQGRDAPGGLALPPELINYTSVVLTTLFIMIGLIFVLNLGFGRLITLLFTK